MKLKFSIIIMMVLYTITTISSLFKEEEEKVNTQNNEGNPESNLNTSTSVQKILWHAEMKVENVNVDLGYFKDKKYAKLIINHKIKMLVSEGKYSYDYSISEINLNQINSEEHFLQNKTSKYSGVSWCRENKRWKAQLRHNKKSYYLGRFDTEEHAAMSVNLCCDKYELERKNPTINLQRNAIQQQFKNPTSKYAGVSWDTARKKWQATLTHNKKNYYGGLFDDEERAAMSINLLCDKFEITRKHLTINIIQPDAIQQVKTPTSKYIGVSWNKTDKNWKAQLRHDQKIHYFGKFDNEEHAAMSVNLFCDTVEIKRKNPTVHIEPNAIQRKIKSKIMCQSKAESIVEEKIKVEDKNELDRFTDECESSFAQSKDEEKNVATRSYIQSQKRKRNNEGPIINDVKAVEKVEMATRPNHVKYEMLEEIQNNYTKIQD